MESQGRMRKHEANAETPYVERRSGKDRRAPSKRPSLKYLLMGKRRGPRRVGELATSPYVEVYGLKIFLAVLSLLVLTTLDALFTLYHVSRGAREINPTMNYLLRLGVNEFFYVKYIVTCLCLIFLCLHKNFPWVKEIIVTLILVYIFVISWHLYLISI